MDLRSDAPRAFTLERGNDESGVSGTGVILEGVVFSDGTVSARWRTETSSSVVYACFEDFWTIHIASHPSNNSVVRFLDGLVIDQRDPGNPWIVDYLSRG